MSHFAFGVVNGNACEVHFCGHGTIRTRQSKRSGRNWGGKSLSTTERAWFKATDISSQGKHLKFRFCGHARNPRASVETCFQKRGRQGLVHAATGTVQKSQSQVCHATVTVTSLTCNGVAVTSLSCDPGRLHILVCEGGEKTPRCEQKPH